MGLLIRLERGGSQKAGGGLAVLIKDNLTGGYWNGLTEGIEEKVLTERMWLLGKLSNEPEDIIPYPFPPPPPSTHTPT